MISYNSLSIFLTNSLLWHFMLKDLACCACHVGVILMYGGNYQNHITFHSVPVFHAYQMQLMIAEPLQCCKWALDINQSTSTWGCIINGSFKHSHLACKNFKNLEICWHISRWKPKFKNATIFKWAIPSPHAGHQLSYSPSSSLDWDCKSGYSSKMTSSTRLPNWSTITYKMDKRFYGRGNSSLGGWELAIYFVGKRSLGGDGNDTWFTTFQDKTRKMAR